MIPDNFFLEAIGLAKTVKGKTSPNPAVGCVIVKNGRIIGRGATQKAGGNHAEIVALKEAGIQAKNAILYVTLEPCIEYNGKKTASCTRAIIHAGVKEVFVGMKDPNPHINGKGIDELRASGVTVYILHEHRKEIQKLNEDFFKFIQTGIPYIYGKYAMTLDGNIADQDGDSKWISSEESRKWVHNFRNRVDGILVGIGTVLKDNPQLNVRMVKKIKDPVRIIIDPKGETPENFHVMNDDGKTIFIIAKNDNEKFKKTCKQNGKEWLEMDTDEGVISLKETITILGKEKCFESILIEGGGRVFFHALQEKVIDKLIVCIAPKILCGKGIPPFNGKSPLKISEALQIKDISVENIGDDIFIQGYL